MKSLLSTAEENTVISEEFFVTQTGTFSAVPDGWAILPDGMETPNFPFGEVTVDNSAPPVVTSWKAGELPEPEPEPDGGLTSHGNNGSGNEN